MSLKSILVAVAVAVLAGIGASGAAHAQACAISLTQMNFGNLTLARAGASDTTATVAVTCTGLAGQTIRVCPVLVSAANMSATGSLAPGGTLTRGGDAAGNGLPFLLYSDPARTVPWNQGIDVVLDARGNGSARQAVYGRLLANAHGIKAGTYQALVPLSFVSGYAQFAALCGGGPIAAAPGLSVLAKAAGAKK